jgi:ribosomal protein S18 acetylase RimI-like enzyme
LKLTLTEDAQASAADAAQVMIGLRTHNLEKTGDGNFRALRVFAHDDVGELVGGVLCDTYWGWLDVGSIWVNAEHRLSGIGTQLMLAAEEEGQRRGARQAVLDTFSFQARGFYERLGYRVVGTLDEFPPGHQRFFMAKRLAE